VLLQLWAEWVVQGDTNYRAGSNTVIESPLFTTTIEGGWFKKSAYSTVTKAGVDPALALMIAHLCYTEYSVEEIKRDLRPNTPTDRPRCGPTMRPCRTCWSTAAATWWPASTCGAAPSKRVRRLAASELVRAVLRLRDVEQDRTTDSCRGGTTRRYWSFMGRDGEGIGYGNSSLRVHEYG
jgi:hypothetical protein